MSGSMKEFFNSTPAQAIMFVAALCGIAGFAAPYFTSPVPVKYSPIIGLTAGVIAALIVNGLVYKRSATWSTRRMLGCFVANVLLFVAVIVFQVVLTISADAETAQISIYTNRLHGVVVRFWSFLPTTYFGAIAVTVYSGLSGIHWYYRWATDSR